MGNRANAVIRDGNEEVFLYTHWGGTELPEDVHKALAKRERWDDPQYLARIVFCQMIGDDKGDTGYGISASLGDNEYPLVVLDTDQQKVIFEKEGKRPRKVLKEISFENAAKGPLEYPDATD